MKNTRRFLAAVMALVMAAGTAMYASAEDTNILNDATKTNDTNVKYSVDPSYTVVIPADVTLSDSKDVTADIELDKPETFKLAKGEKLSVKIASEEFKVTNNDCDVTYTILADSTALTKGSVAAEFAEGNTDAKTLTFPKLDPTKAKYAGEYTGTLTFTIAVETAPTTVDVTGISLNKPTLGLTAGGDPATLTATVSPDNATDKTVTWTTSNASVATVADGVVTPVAAGTATITATAGGKTATCTVTVEPATVAVTGVSLNKYTLELTAGGGTETLTATVAPDDATDKTVTWTSSDTSVATVSGGVVKPVKAGTATITATAGDKTATCNVTVKASTVTLADAFKNGATIKLRVVDKFGELGESSFVNDNGSIIYKGETIDGWFTADARASISGDNLTIQLCGYSWEYDDNINTFVFNKANNTYSYTCGGYSETTFNGLIINGIDITDKVSAQ